MSAPSTSRVPKLRVALIGPGRISVAHLAAVRAGKDFAELVAVAGLPQEEKRIQELAERFGARKALIGAEAVFRDPEIEAVILTVPNQLHCPLAIRALESGKHVLVEKPLARTVAEVDAMIAAASRAERVLMVGQCRRFFRGSRIAKERVAELGRPLNITSILGVYTLQPRTAWWKSATDVGGLALGLNGPHVVDPIVWLIGTQPIRVYAQTQRFRSGWEGEDEASLSITFEDGSMATAVLSESMRPHVNERWIVGPNGMMKVVDDRNLWLNGEPVVQEEVTPYLEGDAGFAGQFGEFASAIREKRTPLASAEEGRPVIQVLEAARLSAAQNRPIDLARRAA